MNKKLPLKKSTHPVHLEQQKVVITLYEFNLLIVILDF